MTLEERAEELLIEVKAYMRPSQYERILRGVAEGVKQARLQAIGECLAIVTARCDDASRSDSFNLATRSGDSRARELAKEIEKLKENGR